ncbi:hypothetical protein ABPG72_009360 [Tetrahymena utriculariae]
MSAFIPNPANSAWQQPVDLYNEDLLEQEELAYEEELKAIHVHEINYNYGMECRDDNYQEDEEMEDPEDYDDTQRQGERYDEGMDVQQ